MSTVSSLTIFAILVLSVAVEAQIIVTRWLILPTSQARTGKVPHKSISAMDMESSLREEMYGQPRHDTMMYCPACTREEGIGED